MITIQQNFKTFHTFGKNISPCVVQLLRSTTIGDRCGRYQRKHDINSRSISYDGRSWSRGMGGKRKDEVRDKWGRGVDAAGQDRGGVGRMRNGWDKDFRDIWGKGPVQDLTELASAHLLDIEFKISSEYGPPHAKGFTVTCQVEDKVTTGEGWSKKAAKDDAALKMLPLLDHLPPLDKQDREKIRKEKLKQKRLEARDARDRAVVDLDRQDEVYLRSLIRKFDNRGREEKLEYENQALFDIKEVNLNNHTPSKALSQNDALDEELYQEWLDKQNRQHSSETFRFRTQLPSWEMRDDIMDMVSDNQVCLISGATGCGKTTQVAQFILDDCMQNNAGSTCHIICTQPRRISAISVATRVAAERGEPLGESCGYEIRMERNSPRREGSVVFCTLGVLLRKMISDPNILQASHIIVDEIHERDTLSDFLLVILKDLLKVRPDLKVILMSATLNAELFSKYFDDCPGLEIPGTAYEVRDHYLEEFVHNLKSYDPNQPIFNKFGKIIKRKEPKEDSNSGSMLDNVDAYNSYVNSLQGKYSQIALRKLRDIDYSRVDENLVTSVVEMICETKGEGAILIFVPGWKDIENVDKALKNRPFFRNASKFKIIPLHSRLSTVDQRQVFERPPPGCRKIVISTNIAETSITIDDVVFVIDCGRDKESNYDVEMNVSSLDTSWISKASEKQRRGRAGRVQNGHCYHLFTKWHHDNFRDFTLPELLRTKLDSLSLQIKLLQLGGVRDFLQKAIEPPSSESCDLAIRELTQMRALDENENLTSLGYYLANLPVTPKVGRMILFGAMFSCLDPILTVAGSLETKDPFTTRPGKEILADKKKRDLSDNSGSDHIALINAFHGWQNSEEKQQNAYCYDHFLNRSHLMTIDRTKKQLERLLMGIGFLKSSNPGNNNVHSHDNKIVKAVICAGLYPNVAKIKKTKKGGRVANLEVAEDGRPPMTALLHPKSVNSEEKLTEDSQWLIYHEKMRMNGCVKVFDSTMISPYSLLFFGGSMRYYKEKGYGTVEVDQGIKFHASDRTAKLIMNLREQVDRLLGQKIRDPKMQLIAADKQTAVQLLSDEQKILKAVIELISTEEISSKKSVRR